MTPLITCCFVIFLLVICVVQKIQLDNLREKTNPNKTTNKLRQCRGDIYLDSETNKKVEFCYMGMTGLAIVCEPGDSGGGMQSTWGIEPERLQKCN